MVTCKWNYSHRRGPGRPCVMQTIVNLVLRMALENRSWGYTRIQGAMANLGHEVARGTIANILREYGIDPAPERDKHVVDVPSSSSGMPGGDRFSHRRGLHDQGTGDTLRSVLHRYRQPRREDRGYHSPSRQPVDDADRAESHRPERRLASRQALLDSRSGYELLGRIPQRSRPRRHSSRSIAGTIAEFERFRRAVRAFN